MVDAVAPDHSSELGPEELARFYSDVADKIDKTVPQAREDLIEGGLYLDGDRLNEVSRAVATSRVGRQLAELAGVEYHLGRRID